MRGCDAGLNLIREGFPEEVRLKLKDEERRGLSSRVECAVGTERTA